MCPPTICYAVAINVSHLVAVCRRFAVGIGGMDCRLLKYKILPPKLYGPGV